MCPLTPLLDEIPHAEESRYFGRITAISGLVISCKGLTNAAIGSYCQLKRIDGTEIPAEVVGYSEGHTHLMPYGVMEGLAPGCRVYQAEHSPVVQVNHSVVGRMLNGMGEPIDGKGPLATLGGTFQPLKASPPSAGSRNPVGEKLDVGVRVLNTFVPICKGQRLGIFSGSGVGKSVLMSMLAKHSAADINVIGLIGERGREVREFVEEQLGKEGMAKSVVIVATSDEPPLMRRQAAYMSLAISEYFRDCGFQVMLMMDSVTRFALAQREIGLASGEPPTTRGYTPSVFTELPKLLERAGPGTGAGAISAIFTVLVEGGDLDEPVADAVRGILDGHIVLTRKLAERGHFPAVDVLKSISRMVPNCLSQDEYSSVQAARQVLSTYTDMEELIRLGAYQKGSDPQVDSAIKLYPVLSDFLKQHPQDKSGMQESFTQLRQVLGM